MSPNYLVIDLELFNLNSHRLHRPAGTFAAATFSSPKVPEWLVETPEEMCRVLKAHDKPSITWVFHNAAFDLRHIRRWYTGLAPRPIWDTMLLEKILFGGLYEDFGLSDLARRYLGKALTKEVRKEFSESTSGEMTSEMREYALQDIRTTRKIYLLQRENPNIDSALQVWKNYDAPALWASLDFKGFLLDREQWTALADLNAERADGIRTALGFNPGSPPQTKAAFAKHRVNLPDTSEATLVGLNRVPPEALELRDMVLKYRESAKRASTYGRTLLDRYQEEDGRIYSNFNIIGAETGRMSSRDPNMQNIPHDPEFRKCFIAGPKKVLIIADYSQQEPRITAELTGDPGLIRAFVDGVDIHLLVARAIYHDEKMDKHDPRRKVGKTLNLGLTYGLTDRGLAAKASIPLEEARELVKMYFQRFAGVRRWMNSQRAFMREHGYVQTLGGRVIHINPHSYQADNNAINAPVQGTAADMTKLALALLHKQVGSALPVVAVVHDEIVMEVPKREQGKWSKALKQAMTDAYTSFIRKVPAKNVVEISVGSSWADK